MAGCIKGFSKIWRQSGQNCWYFVVTRELEPTVCLLALSASSVSSVRAAAEAGRFGAPFLLLQLLLSLLLAVPLTMFELGVGQFSQQGAAAVWRAIPALRGVAFVRLMCALVCALWAAVQVGVAAAYAARTAAYDLPMQECTQLSMTEHGYYQNNTLGLECALRTFLKPYSEESTWFSIMCILFFITWIIIPVCLYNLDNGLKYTMCTLALVYVVLLASVCIAVGEIHLGEVLEGTDWSALRSSRMWFAATWQVLLSNRIGLAYLETVGGTIYFRAHAVRWAFGLVGCNVAAGWLGALAWFSASDGGGAGGGGDDSPLAVLLWTYDAAVVRGGSRLWPCLAFLALLCAAIITMLSFVHPVLSGLSRSWRARWRAAAAALAAGAAAATMALFAAGPAAAAHLERHAVPLLVCALLVIEIFAFMFIYGWRNLIVDLEFMVGRRLSPVWVVWWPLAAVALLALACWEVTCELLGGWPGHDGGLLQAALLASLMGTAVLTVLVWAAIVIVKQDEYDCLLKMQSSLKASRKWGPVEPILRHLWIQWASEPHGAELVAQLAAHREGAPPLHSPPKSVSDASRKSSYEEFDPTGRTYSDDIEESRRHSEEFEASRSYSEKEISKRSSLENGEFKKPVEEIHRRYSQTDRFSNRSSSKSSSGVYPAKGPPPAPPTFGPTDRNTAPTDHFYTHFKQIYY